MPFVKVSNKGKNILFIDSLGLTLRPYKNENDFYLVDEEKANSDPQFMKCLLVGSIEVNKIDNISDSNKKKKVIVKVEKIEEVNDKTEFETNNVETKDEVVEPTNIDPVVVLTANKKGQVKTSRASRTKIKDSKMPIFIKEDDIRDMSENDIDEEALGEKDIDLSKISDN